jgi:hypothetical protein
MMESWKNGILGSEWILSTVLYMAKNYANHPIDHCPNTHFSNIPEFLHNNGGHRWIKR